MTICRVKPQPPILLVRLKFCVLCRDQYCSYKTHANKTTMIYNDIFMSIISQNLTSQNRGVELRAAMHVTRSVCLQTCLDSGCHPGACHLSALVMGFTGHRPHFCLKSSADISLLFAMSKNTSCYTAMQQQELENVFSICKSI